MASNRNSIYNDFTILNTHNQNTDIPDINSNELCHMCNGYYGPCFGEPVCATCHAFLFPNYALIDEEVEVFTEKSDDGDSGNDEPADVFFPLDRFQISQSFESNNDRPVPLDSVTHRLELLSVFTPQYGRQNDSSIYMELLPTEVLLSIFEHLDEWSLWSVANVCMRWQNLIKYEVPVKKWKDMTIRKFPLFEPLLPVDDWFDVYSNLMKSCFCSLCLRQMTFKIQPVGEENSWRRNRLRNEMKIMRSDPPDGIRAIPLDPPTCCHWQATIAGPTGSPYEGGIFFLYVQVPYSYPMSPPVVRFITKIYHPNISRHGDIGIDSIHHNWSLALTISKVLISVQSLLTDPYCEICMEPEIGKLYQTNRTAFDEQAQRWTWRYAMLDFADYCQVNNSINKPNDDN